MIKTQARRWLMGGILVAVVSVSWVAMWSRRPKSASADRPVGTSIQSLLTLSKPRSSYTPSARSADVLTAPRPWKRSPRTLKVTSVAVSKGPALDGVAGGAAWAKAAAVTTVDAVSQRPVTIRSVHTADRIFFLVTYPDSQASQTHKSFRWHSSEGVYKPMNDREDTFVFKWSMQGNEVDLSLRSGASHRADVWFWKAYRTNPAGFADDKWHEVSPTKHEHSLAITEGKAPQFLRRVADAGQSAYHEGLVFEHRGDYASRYTHRAPNGSRADIQAKGRWDKGVWTIEFSRALQTHQSDDVAFRVGGSYLFGISCYEMAGGGPEPDLYRPLYKMGDVFDRLILQIEPEDAK